MLRAARPNACRASPVPLRLPILADLVRTALRPSVHWSNNFLTLSFDWISLQFADIAGPAGTDVPEGSSACTPCKAGTYADHAATPSCTSCPANSTTPQPGSTSSTACTPCNTSPQLCANCALYKCVNVPQSSECDPCRRCSWAADPTLGCKSW